MRNVADSVVEKIKIHISCSIIFFVNRVVYEAMWKNIVEPYRRHLTIWRLLIACWIPKATDMLSGYIILKLFHCNNGCKNVPQHYVIGTLPVLLL